MDQVYVCIYVVRAGHIFKAFNTQAAFTEKQDAACLLGHFTVQQKMCPTIRLSPLMSMSRSCYNKRVEMILLREI